MAMLNNKMVKKTKQLSRVMAALKGQSVVKSKSAGHDERGCAAMRMQRLSVAWIKPEISWNSGDFMMGLQEDGIWRPYNPITTLTLN